MLAKGDKIARRYTVVEQIGSGRTSLVYQGIDKKTGDTVAIKSIRREYLTANPDGTMRFMREGSALKQLSHPNIVKVFDNIQEDDGSYIIMEFLGGGTLEYRITTQGAYPLVDGLRIIHKIASALAHLHSVRIIHRDLSTQNVIFDDDGEPHLMDLSVAHMGHMSPMTLKNQLLGTVTYMSPEMILERVRASEKTDIYALGIIVYRVLTGQTPFQINRPSDVIKATRTPAPPLDTFLPDAPPALNQLVAQMVAMNPNKRLKEASRVAQTVGDILDQLTSQ